jgi:delta-aminolevulinic acid dehydratase/porphobilinogen synthase
VQTPDHLKTPTAEEAFNPNGLSQRTIRLLKDAFPDVEVSPAVYMYIVAWILIG